MIICAVDRAAITWRYAEEEGEIRCEEGVMCCESRHPSPKERGSGVKGVQRLGVGVDGRACGWGPGGALRRALQWCCVCGASTGVNRVSVN